MKKTILSAILFFSVSSFAAHRIEFRDDSSFNSSAKKAIENAIVNQCSEIVEKGWRISESNTETLADPKYYVTAHYRTLFAVSGMDNDNMHPYNFSLSVNAIQIANTPLKIISVVCHL
jgi:hypothetical protein